MTVAATHSSLNLRGTYQRSGWVLIPGLLPRALTDSCLKIFLDEILPSQSAMLRQSGAVESHQVTPEGQMKNGLLNPHKSDAKNVAPGFQSAVLDLATHPAMQEVLKILHGRANSALMQTMFFDHSPATAPHQDCVYLDSVPAGHLIGAWIAIEDIAPDAGRFYVLPYDATPPLPAFTREDVWENKSYMPRLRAFFRAHQDKMVSPPMRAGDVLFWNSHIIHGAERARDSRLSRKSLTAHYLPEGYAYGNVWGETHEVPFGIKNHMKVFGV